MENYQSEDILELEFQGSLRESLAENAKWARRLAIVSIAFIALVVIGIWVLRNTPIIDEFTFEMEEGGLQFVIWILVVLFLLVVGVWAALLTGFANKTMRGVEEHNGDYLENGISMLKMFMIYAGVLSMLGVLFSLFDLF